MEVKKLLTKSLLVMAGLCVGANASWAQNWGDPLVTYNFENSETYTTDWPTANTGNKNEVKQVTEDVLYVVKTFKDSLLDNITKEKLTKK